MIVFEDNKAVENCLSLMKGLYNYPLNHLQFLEVTSNIFYAKSLALNVPNYMTHYHMTSKKMQVRSLNSLHSRNWNDKEYALVLESMMESEGVTADGPIYSNGIIKTFLVDVNNELYLHKIKSGS